MQIITDEITKRVMYVKIPWI